MDDHVKQRLADDEKGRKTAPKTYRAEALLWPSGGLNMRSIDNMYLAKQEMESTLYKERHPFIRKVKITITIDD